MEKFAIVIPIRNEAKRIVQFNQQLQALDVPYFFVDDGSTDDTVYLIYEHHIPCVSYYPPQGKGFALKLGARTVMKMDIDWILTMDMDGFYDVAKTVEQLDTLLLFHENDTDLFVGNRLWNRYSMKWFTYYSNKLISWWISLKAGKKLADVKCGVRLLNKKVFDLDCTDNHTKYESDVLIYASKLNWRIKEVQIDYIGK